jgi:hypothetical protein
MSTYTFYSAANDGGLRSTAVDYENCRAGLGLVEFPAAGEDYMLVGQNTAKIYEGFLRFDTNSIPDSYTITAATFATYLEPSSHKNFSIEARTRDWGTSLEVGDWVPGEALNGLTLLASYPASSMNYVMTQWYTELALSSAINKSGYTKMVLCSSRTTTDQEPVGAEYAHMRTSEYAGTAMDPCLTVTAVPPGGGRATRLQTKRGTIW